jgi:hypothetical protein
MLGGGNFTAQNKVLPGAYINFVSAASARAAMGERGVAAIPMVLDWGPEQTVFEVSAEEFQEKSREIFGYAYDDAAITPVRELFQHLTKGIFYRLNTGIKAGNDYGIAAYGGVGGNRLNLVIAKNIDDETKFDVKTLFAGKEVDIQTVADAGSLKDQAYVTFKKDVELMETAGTPFYGGMEGAAVTGEDYVAFLARMESCVFQVLCCPSSEESVKALFAAFTRRMRDENGIKFQTVLYRYAQADYEGILSVENETEELATGLVYWTAGAEAACAIHKTVENQTYDGEYSVRADYTQTQLKAGVQAGKFLFHKAGSEIRVLMDINTLVTYTEEKGEDFSSNQTIRVLDQIGNDIASLFHTRYLGKMPNDAAGRLGLWNDIVTYGKQLTTIRAIEAVRAESITVDQGFSKRSVVVKFPVEPINCMSQLYMTVVVS